MTLRTSILALALALVSQAAQTGESLTDEHGAYLLFRFDEIAKARGLTVHEASVAKETAIGWYYAGPCKGARMKLSLSADIERSIVYAADNPTSNLGTAIQQMIAVLVTNHDFGRTPSDRSCSFAEVFLSWRLEPTK